MKTVIAFCFLILCHGTIAQSASILNSCDSLWTLWLNESNSDSVRLTAILEYSYLKFGRSNPDSSRYILRKEISYAEEKKLPNFVVSGLNDMADTFLEQSAFDSADFYFNQALNLAEKINDKKGLATAYNGIGNTFRLTKHYQKAIEYYLLSLRINTELNNLSGVGSVYNNLGTVNRMIGNYDEAINYFLKSVEIKQHLNEKKWMGGTYSNLGLVYKIQGDFVKALMYYEMAYQIDLELGNISGVSVSLNGLGNLYKQQGNFESALEYYKIALKYFQQLNNKKNSATVLMNIGSVFHLKYEYDSALIYYQNSLEILEEIKDKNGIGVVSNNLGTYYYELGDYEKAIEIHNLSLDIKTKNGDKPGMAYSFVSISLCYLKMDSIDLATEFAIRAYQIAEQIGDVYLLKNTILTLLKINLKILNYDVASQYLERLIWIIKSQISKNYFTLSEQEKELYFNTMESDIGVYLDFTVFVGDSYPGFKDSSFNLILQTKGITLKSSTLVRKTITESHDSLLLKTYEEWIKKSAKIAELNLSGKDVQELENEARQLEKNLIQRSGVFSDFDKIQNLDWKQVRDGLNPGEAAIEFVHFKSVINLTRSVVYAAFIVKPECQHPEVVNLCTEAELKNILGVIQGNNLSFVERVYGKKSDAKKDLYEKIWQPLEPFLEGVKTVYYSPSGLLHKVSFAAMSKDQDVYLSDVYNFRQMGSTGNLAFENNTSFGELENFLLMGGVQY
ncbi:MAG: tetratricopeptide repeat protein, partial [Crocinitomicaceae bacterium]|nr:tetratricopeptide repeat protein [Crocinitomicaceae bacterium]